MRYALISMLALCAIAAQAIPQAAAKRKIPCKTPEIAASCYWTRGRLGVYNGNPSFRVWRIGTTRIVGIHSGPGAQRRDPEDGEHPEFPPNIERLVDGMVTASSLISRFAHLRQSAEEKCNSDASNPPRISLWRSRFPAAA
jgi:hypothetical protein